MHATFPAHLVTLGLIALIIFHILLHALINNYRPTVGLLGLIPSLLTCITSDMSFDSCDLKK
jgi:hypothetical protein